MDSALAHLKHSYLIVPIAVLIVIGWMKIDAYFADEDRPASSYVKAILLTAGLTCFFLYIHAIDESTFEVGQIGIPSF